MKFPFPSSSSTRTIVPRTPPAWGSGRWPSHQAEGFEVLGVTSYGDLASSPSSKAAPAPSSCPSTTRSSPWAGIRGTRPCRTCALHRGGAAQEQPTSPIYVRRDDQPHLPNDIPARAARLHPHVRGHARVCGQASSVRPRATWRACSRRSSRRCWTTPRTAPTAGTARPLGRRGVLKSPVGQMFTSSWREHAARRRLQRGGRTGPAVGPQRRGWRVRAQCGAHLQRRPLLLRHQRHQHQPTRSLAPRGGPGDVVVVDRNCHKSILHSIIMTGAIPVFLKPTRNHFGIIGPIPQSEFEPRPSGKIRANPAAQDVDADSQAAHPDADAVHLRRRALQHRDHQGHADGYVDNLHFDEAWLPHAAFHPSTAPSTPWAEAARPSSGGLCHAVHPQAAGRHQPGLARAGAGQPEPSSSTATCSTRPT